MPYIGSYDSLTPGSLVSYYYTIGGTRTTPVVLVRGFDISPKERECVWYRVLDYVIFIRSPRIIIRNMFVESFGWLKLQNLISMNNVPTYCVLSKLIKSENF